MQYPIGDLRRLADWMETHDVYIRRVTANGILAACAANTREGYTFSDLSPLIRNITEARNWLGY